MGICQGGLGRKRAVSVDAITRVALTAVASVAVLAIIFIILFIADNGVGALRDVSLWDFITGSTWRPYQDAYGASSLIVGTLLVTAGAVLFAFPVGLGLAVYLAELAPAKVRRFLKPAVELFAGIPSVIYGFLGLVVLVPALAQLFPGQTTTGFCWLAGSLLLGVMALPEIVSVADDALRAVPATYCEASLGLGATKWETIRKVVVPAASSGITAAAILGIGRAVGETMAVMMVTGNTALLPEPLWNVFATVRTLTATIAMELPEAVTGSTAYSALFLLALILMVIILAVNLTARTLVARSAARFTGAEPGRIERRLETLKESCGTVRLQVLSRLLRAALLLALVFFILSLFVGSLAAFAAAVAIILIREACGRAMAQHFGRRRTERAAHVCLAILAVLMVGLIVAIIGYVAVRGAPALSWEFLTAYPTNAGKSGGIFPAIVGTLELLVGTAAIAIPIGVLSGAYLAEYTVVRSRGGRLIRDAVDVLNGTPSIVFGLFGLATAVVWLGWGFSLVAGWFTLSLMVLPVIIRTTQEAVRAVPAELREASRALGASQTQTIFRVVLPAALGGIVTGTVLSLGRAAGETAPIMFTAVVVTQSRLADSVFDPVMALPYHLYYLASEGRADPAMMFGTALVLLIIVLGLFGLATAVRYWSERRLR